MKLVLAAALAACLALALPARVQADDLPLSSPPPPMTAQGDALYARMLAVNSSVKTIEANVELRVAFRSFPFIKHSLEGSYYYKRPDKQVVVFDTVPALAKEFKKVYPNVDPPSAWKRLYTFGVVSDENGVTTFRLVPIVNSRIESLDVKVDDATATVSGYTWTYKDGGYVTFDQTVASVDGAYVVTEQTGRVELPAYKVDTSAAFSNYKINVALQDSLFKE
jgi:hypothetical protein